MASDANPPPPPEWIYATATGLATATPVFYLYLNGAGEAYIDDVKLVSGNVAESGTSLLRNGDFESPLANDWQVTTNFADSVISTTRSHSGGGSLRLVASAAGTGNGNALFQTNIVGLTNGLPYTVSFWYSTPSRGRTLTARLSGNQLAANVPDAGIGSLKRRLDTIASPSPVFISASASRSV